MPLVEQELLTLPEHLSSPRFVVGFMLLDLWFCMCVLWIVVCPFVLFLLAIVHVLSVDIRILITPLVTSNSSFQEEQLWVGG